MPHRVSVVCAAIAACASALACAFGCNGGEDLSGLLLGSEVSTDGGAGATSTTGSSACAEMEDDATPYDKLADPSTLPACSPVCGGAHCVPGDKIPASGHAMFAACGGGFCIPDALIESGGAAPPRCVSLGGSDGVCLSMCVPQVGDNKDALEQTTCAADERCAPCINPQSGQRTGACDLGAPVPTSCGGDAGGATAPVPLGDGAAICPHTGPPVLDPATFPACGDTNGGAHCLKTGLVPTALAPSLGSCAGGYCVPDKIIAAGGNVIPATCTSIAGAEGRCASLVLPSVAAQANLPVATCDANERCAPCFNPLDGSDTGICHTSCDPGPTEPAVLLAACCGTLGKCAPTEMVAASEQTYLYACTGGDLCVPNENLAATFTPPKCHVDGILTIGEYDGVCLSNCLNFGSAKDSLDRGNCDTSHTCVPCIDPNSGNPTHAPGCS